MFITIEISYYPLVSDFIKPIDEFLKKLDDEKIIIEVGNMSTIISGEYEDVMSIVSKSMFDLMNNYPSVFSIKISNSCIIKK